LKFICWPRALAKETRGQRESLPGGLRKLVAEHTSKMMAADKPPYDDEDAYRPEPELPPQPPSWQDGSIRIGIHTSIAGDIVESLEIAHRLGANALQIFSASPRMWPQVTAQGFGKALPLADAERFRARRNALGLGPVVVHDNYLINLASPERVLRVRSIQAFHDEVVRAMALGADFLVAHPGASRGDGLPRAVEHLANAIRQATRGLSLGRLRILMENTAGQGTALGSRLEELKLIIEACPELELGVCLDTAHLFAAGYPIHTAEGLEKTLQAIEHTIGLNRVHVFHVNDSKAAFGSRVDRHEHIGKGRIGLEAFRRFLNHPLLSGRAFILETPIDKPGDDLRNVQALWRLVGVESRPAAGAKDGFRARIRKKAKPPARKPKARAKKRRKK
jgi:deoxyribonuclease-4